jgi:hypothetical protein
MNLCIYTAIVQYNYIESRLSMLSYLGEYSISTVSLYVLLISVNTTSLCPIIQASKLTCERSKYNMLQRTSKSFQLRTIIPNIILKVLNKPGLFRHIPTTINYITLQDMSQYKTLCHFKYLVTDFP